MKRLFKNDKELTKTFRKNEDFFKWIKENREKITNIHVYLIDEKIRVNFYKL